MVPTTVEVMKNITHDENYIGVRSAFDDYLDFMSSKLPTSFEDPIWNKELKKGKKHFTSKQQQKNHLKLPIKYNFYDPSF